MILLRDQAAMRALVYGLPECLERKEQGSTLQVATGPMRARRPVEAAMPQPAEARPVDLDAAIAAAHAAWFAPKTVAVRNRLPDECDGCGRDLGDDADEGLCPSCAVERIWGDD